MFEFDRPRNELVEDPGGQGVLYCERCGAANDNSDRDCHRCGGTLSAIESVHSTAWRTAAVDVAAAQSSSIEPPPASGAADADAEPGTIQRFDLPEWLIPAPAHTPTEPPEPPGGQALPPADIHGAPAEPEGFETEPETRPLPPVPAADLPMSMPEWLKSPPAVPIPQHTESTQFRGTRSAEPDTDEVNMGSFISESDLPEWILKISAADAARQAEAERTASESTGPAEAQSPREIQFPGEMEAPELPPNPWLVRREAAGASQSWSADAGSSTIPAGEATPYRAPARSEPAAVTTNAAMPKPGRGLPERTLPVTSGRSGRGTGSRTRLYLTGAGILLLVVLLLMLL